MIKICEQCNKEFESETGRKRFCPDCKLQRRRQSCRDSARDRRASANCKKRLKRGLLYDASRAKLNGLTYGQYIAKRNEGLL